MINFDKLKRGKKKEDSVEEFFLEKGWKVSKNIFYDEEGNETSQFIVIDGFPKSYPDLTIEKYKDAIYVKYLIEVKSLNRYFLNGKSCVTVPCYQFLSYKDIEKHEDIPVHIMFVLYQDAFDKEEWYTQTLEKLDKSKTYIENAYKDEDRHYVWSLGKLKKVK